MLLLDLKYNNTLKGFNKLQNALVISYEFKLIPKNHMASEREYLKNHFKI